jgi:hypothetical protein
MADPTVFSFTLLDYNGIKATTRAYAQYNGAVVTVDSLIGNWLALGALIDTASNAQILGGRIQIPLLPGGGWKAAPVAENDVADVIVLDFSNVSNRYAHEFLLPNHKDAQLTNGQVNLAEAGLAALVAYIINSGGTATYSNTQGHDIDALMYAFLSDRTHRRVTRSKSIAYP